MTFQEYVTEEITNQDLYEDIDFDDPSIGYSYELEYTTLE